MEPTFRYEEDQQWVEQLQELVQKELSNYQFTVATLADQMAISKRGLETKLKDLTGLSPHAYIRETRFAEAYRRLQSGRVKSIKNLVAQLGMKDASHFSKLFKLRFGKRPSEFLESRVIRAES